MEKQSASRQEVLLGAVGVATGVSLTGAGTGAASSTTSFAGATSPTTKSILATLPTARGPYAVGNSGKILRRTPNGWELVIESGVTTQGKGLNDVAVSDDGEALWMAGSSGVIGRYDVVAGELSDYSKPRGFTTTFISIEAAGDSGIETVLASDTSGNVVRGKMTHCGILWLADGQPTGGNAVQDIGFYSASEGTMVDSTGSVFESTDDGVSWTQIGISNFGNSLNSIDAKSSSDLMTAGSSGSVVSYDGSSWVQDKAGSNTLQSIDRDGGQAYTSGSSGTLYEQTTDGWTSVSTDTGATLHDIGLGTSSGYPDAVVGGSGTILEKGQYTATNDSFTLKNNGSQTVQYEATVDGLLEKANSADSTESTTSNGDGTVTATGEIGAGDIDGFNFSGDLTGITIPSGTRENIELTVNGLSMSLGRVASATWTPVSDTPTTKTLYSITDTSEGLVAVGGGGKVLQRDGSGNWSTIVKNGPGSNGNALYCSDSSYNGSSVWFAGSSGAFGRYDVTSDTIQDFTAPQDLTGTWKSIAIRGYAGTEQIYLGNGSGSVLYGEYHGGNITWQGPVTPGDGSSIRSIDFNLDHGRDVFMCDSNGKVFRQLDDYSNWNTIGIQNPGSTLYDLRVTKDMDVLVSGGSGRKFRLGDGTWTSEKLGGNSRYGVDTNDDRQMIVGASGQVFERSDRGWKETVDYQSTPIRDVIVRDSMDLPAVAVGGSGTILEKTYDTL